MIHSAPSVSLPIHKYHGLGNDFVLLDNRQQPELLITPQQVIQICDRRFGVGADGVIFLLPSQSGSDFTMRIINSDGSEPEMCGNGIRCLAQFLGDLGVKSSTYRIHTLAGEMVLQVAEEGRITVDMGVPHLLAAEIPTTLATSSDKVIEQPLWVAGQTWSVTCVSMGNPHCVTFLPEIASLDLAAIGPQFEHHPVFPKRTNTEFVKVVSRNHLQMRVWERGAGATLACGTGACAVLVAAVLTQQAERQAVVELPGGSLRIEWNPENEHVFMTGPAQHVFSGVYDLV
ncbi:MAG: diaminopimelate epimerase [Cyanobacteriota bacterium]|nr:diaminopimelate epimerase [Cyanobacteriota bacterium]